MSRRVEDYDYAHPPGAAAQVPADERSASRLLCVERKGDGLVDTVFSELPARLRPGDLLVLNETQVAPARLLARRATGGRVSVLVLETDGARATALLGARGTLEVGEVLSVEADAAGVREASGGTGARSSPDAEGARAAAPARWRLVAAHGEGRFGLEDVEGRPIAATMEAAGRMPLPPYIARDPVADPRDALDRERYRTVFEAGPARSAAAPTAGLHFTPALLEAVAARGVAIARLRLEVGEGTFRPLRGRTLDEHVMHAEHYEIPAAAAEAFAAARARGGRVVAVGTTVVRALESAVAPDGRTLRAGPAVTDLFIHPGHRFAAVDALLTNFHQPRSSLLVLVSAFAGRERVLAAYAHAIRTGYRLFSYGDAMFVG